MIHLQSERTTKIIKDMIHLEYIWLKKNTASSSFCIKVSLNALHLQLILDIARETNARSFTARESQKEKGKSYW